MINAFFTHKFFAQNLTTRLCDLLSDNWVSTVEGILIGAAAFDTGATDLVALFRHKANEMIHADQFDIRRMWDAIVKECTPHRTAMVAKRESII